VGPDDAMENSIEVNISRTPTRNVYKTESINIHFGDTVLPSIGKQVKSGGKAPRTTGTATFHIWTIESDGISTDTSTTSTDLIDLEAASANKNSQCVISRVTFFDRAAQPMYPPYIFTRSEHSTLTANVGRIVPLFHQVPQRRNQFVNQGYVKIIAVDVVSAGSEELKDFIERKVAVGGLKKKRTKEQWQDTLSTDWFKVTLRPMEMGIGDPMDVVDIRETLESLETERWI
jgi:hypothetical protein